MSETEILLYYDYIYFRYQQAFDKQKMEDCKSGYDEVGAQCLLKASVFRLVHVIILWDRWTACCFDPLCVATPGEVPYIHKTNIRSLKMF